MNEQIATLGAGCFWCVEAVFQRLNGVEKVASGYANGQLKNPTYKEVCTGKTGHAEVIQITYDETIISFAEILEVFFNTHDPTTLNRQGNDVGTQYRSGIYTHNDEQQKVAEAYKNQLEASDLFSDQIVTEVQPLEVYYSAEGYHQNYFNQNGEQGYCAFVVQPKVEKFQRQFADKVKA